MEIRGQNVKKVEIKRAKRALKCRDRGPKKLTESGEMEDKR